MSTAMEPIPEHDSKQASQAEPTVEQMKNWKRDQLFSWIMKKREQALDDDDIQILKQTKITGEVFWTYAGNEELFESKFNLHPSISVMLANLSREFKEGVTAGNGQQAKNVEMSDSAETRKRKSPPDTDIAPSPKRTRVGKSSLIINGKLKYFRSGSKDFSHLLQREGQAYFDRTGYILKLHELEDTILFCRPRRFGKSLTVSMLEHFHGLQYAGEHQSLYKGLDVQKDIDAGNVKPGQYFVLKFDFSEVRLNPNLTEANETLIKFLNSSLETFYGTYAAYLGRNFADLCQTIDSKEPNISLRWCAQSVQDAIKHDVQLANIEGIYLLVDEYDAFPNNYLEPLQTIGEPKTAWENTAVGYTFKSFWSVIKILGLEGFIRRVFVTGISPLSLSSVGSAFNVLSNRSFDEDLAELCGVTYSDLEDALTGIGKEPEECKCVLSKMAEFYNGYHFCKTKTVKTVYNTETCLASLQSLIQGKTPDFGNPENSEISEQFLRALASSAPAIKKVGLKPLKQPACTTTSSQKFLSLDGAVRKSTNEERFDRILWKTMVRS